MWLSGAATAQIAGLRRFNWHLLFLCLRSTIVLVGTNILGSLMVITFLFLLALAALPWARRLPHAMALAILALLLSLYASFKLSTHYDWPLSQSIASAALALRITIIPVR